MSLSSNFTSFVATNILQPIVAHLQSKGQQVSVNELLEVINLAPSSPVVISPTVSQKSPKREPDPVNGCQFILTKVRKGQACGAKRTANSVYCSRHRDSASKAHNKQSEAQIPVQPQVQLPKLLTTFKPIQKSMPFQMPKIPQPPVSTTTTEDNIDSEDTTQ